MKNIVLILIVMIGFCFTGCAGMSARQNQNMVTNAGVWGVLGAVGSAAVASVTGGDVGRAAVIGGVAGAALGAANTPPEGNSQQSSSYHYGHVSVYDRAYQEEIQRLRREEYYRQRQLERRRAINDARQDYYYRRR